MAKYYDKCVKQKAFDIKDLVHQKVMINTKEVKVGPLALTRMDSIRLLMFCAFKLANLTI